MKSLRFIITSTSFQMASHLFLDGREEGVRIMFKLLHLPVRKEKDLQDQSGNLPHLLRNNWTIWNYYFTHNFLTMIDQNFNVKFLNLGKDWT